MKKTTVYVSGLTPTMTHRQLEQLFAPYGTVESTDVIRVHPSESLGYVDMGSYEAARQAVRALHGITLEGRELFCFLMSYKARINKSLL
jgi:RNA recognition motif-containing protein